MWPDQNKNQKNAKADCNHLPLLASWSNRLYRIGWEILRDWSAAVSFKSSRATLNSCASSNSATTCTSAQCKHSQRPKTYLLIQEVQNPFRNSEGSHSVQHRVPATPLKTDYRNGQIKWLTITSDSKTSRLSTALSATEDSSCKHWSVRRKFDSLRYCSISRMTLKEQAYTERTG